MATCSLEPIEVRGKEGWRGGGGERGESIASAAPGSPLVGTVRTEPLNSLGYTLRIVSYFPQR